jgi:hypothetical protein
MPNVCTNCFADRELVAFISSQANNGACNFCGSTDVPCLPVDELVGFFTELFSNFKAHGGGVMLKSAIQGNWSLFSTIDSAYVLLNHYLSKIRTPIANADQLVDFSDAILENVGYWDTLKKQLLTKHRYITDVNYLTDELGWDGFFSSQIKISKGVPLYRARLHHNSGEPPYAPNNMFCPPANYATAGRANPSGIPYLYLSDNPDTVLYEIRAAYLDEISIGTFEVDDSVVDPVLIADFITSSTIFHPSRVSDRIKSTLLKQKISTDLSKPMRRYDSELEYIPTQFICEFISVYTGVSGIRFRSSLHLTGNNFVIFDQNIMKCTNVRKERVGRVEIAI